MDTHRLPEMPPTLGPIFKELCEELPVSAVEKLKEEVTAALNRLGATEVYEGLPPDLELACACAERANILIDSYESFTPEQRALAVGAIRYFVLDQDSIPDSVPMIGFDDDARVLNYVLAEVGITGHFIEIA